MHCASSALHHYLLVVGVWIVWIMQAKSQLEVSGCWNVDLYLSTRENQRCACVGQFASALTGALASCTTLGARYQSVQPQTGLARSSSLMLDVCLEN